MKSLSPIIAACLICVSAGSSLAFDEISLTRSRQPSALGLSPAGVSYVLDALAANILVVGLDRVVKTSSLCEGILKNPQDIACFEEGIAVLDGADIWYLDAAGRPLKNLTLSRVGIESPRAFCLDHLGYIYVTDAGSSSVYKLDPNGTVVSWTGRWGSETGCFITPVDVAVDGRRNYYVADWDLARVQKFDPMGRFLMTVGEAGDGPGLFRKISAIDVQEDGGLLVADYFRREVQVFLPDGTYRGSLIDVGLPADVKLKDGYVYVLDAEMNSLRRYGLDELSIPGGAMALNGGKQQLSASEQQLKASNGSATMVAGQPQPDDDAGSQPSGGENSGPVSLDPGKGGPQPSSSEQAGSNRPAAEGDGPVDDSGDSNTGVAGPAGNEVGNGDFDPASARVGYRLAATEKRKTYSVEIQKVELLPGGARSAELKLAPMPTVRLLPSNFRVYEGRRMGKVMTVEAPGQGVLKLGYSGGENGGLPATLTVIVSGGRRIGKGTWNRIPDKE